MTSAVRTTAMVMILIACAGTFADMLTFYQVPDKTVQLLTVLTDNPILILLMITLGLGLCTPPVGFCLFVGCPVGKLPMKRAVRTIWPFYMAILVALVFVTFMPAISLTLPRLIGG